MINYLYKDIICLSEGFNRDKISVGSLKSEETMPEKQT